VKRKLFSSGAVICLVLGSLWFYPVHVLSLRNIEDGSWIFYKQVRPGDTFSTRYTHSVKHRPVWDVYYIDQDYRMMLEETIFPGYGYGLPYLTNGDEIFSQRQDGNYSISNIKRHIPSLFLRVERPYDNIFTFDTQAGINLSSLIGDGVVDMRVITVSALTYLCKEII
jgi:hypothetical protein